VLVLVTLLHICSSLPYRDGPLGMDELNMLHADAVKYGSDKGGVWYKAIDAGTLDSLITEMNEMNRWFAKVVKYWDEFTSGGDGSGVLGQTGPGIKPLSDKADEGAGDDAAPAEGEGAPSGGDDTDAEEDNADAEDAGGEDAPKGDDVAGEDEGTDGEGAPGGDDATGANDAAGEDDGNGGDEAPEEDAADGGDDAGADAGAEDGDATGGENAAEDGADKEPAEENDATGDAAAAADKPDAARGRISKKGNKRRAPGKGRKNNNRRMRMRF